MLVYHGIFKKFLGVDGHKKRSREIPQFLTGEME
jgi:hypothetical protein